MKFMDTSTTAPLHSFEILLVTPDKALALLGFLASGVVLFRTWDMGELGICLVVFVGSSELFPLCPFDGEPLGSS